jgi:outer membrane protein assembly factor BamB
MHKIELSKKSLSVITLFLALSIALPLTLSTANAHVPGPNWSIVSYPYISAAPSPVGVGQEVYVFCWVDIPLPSAGVNNDIRRHDYTLVITDPDGANSTQHWDRVDDTTGIQAYAFTPSKVGNYTLSFTYAGQNYTWSGAYQNDWFQAASASRTLEVTEEQVAPITNGASLPTEYWARPINGQNSNWYIIASNWLNSPQIRSGATSTGGAGYGRFQPNGIGPESPHVLWTKPLQFGGVSGSATMNEGESFYTGSSYNPRFSNAIIMQGTLFYQEPYGNAGGGGEYVSVDLLTGKENWRINTTVGGINLTPSIGYLYGYEDGNQHGVLPNGLLIASINTGSMFNPSYSWRAWDARTGQLTNFNMTNIPGGTAASATLASNYATGASALGSRGEILIYNIVSQGGQWFLNLWNSSRYTNYSPGQIGASNWYPSSSNPGFDATNPRMYIVNISLPSLKGSNWLICRDINAGDRLLLIQGTLGVGPRTTPTGANLTCVSIDPDNFGQVLWSKSYDQAPGNVTRHIIAIDYIANTFVTEDKETLVFNGWDLSNGNHLWTANPLVCEWDTLRRDTLNAYGNLYAAGYDGIVYCVDDKTGKLLWTYGNGGEGNTTSSGSDTVYGHYPTFIDVIADGKVYTGTTEHSPDQPLYKGGVFRCLNATTGEELWQMDGMGSGMYIGQNDLVADGCFVYLNIYDMQVYSVGKGASKLTVDAPSAAVTQGQSLVVRGTVTDISAGTTQEEQAARFPNGVPCVSDASQREWMEYVYQQQDKPANATGVPINIAVIDANGNYRSIGTAVSDSSGAYSLQWTPDISGKYTVVATFAGTNAYYGSSAETAFAADNAPEAATPQPTQPASMADLYFVPGIIGVIIAILVVGAVLALLVHKKP